MDAAAGPVYHKHQIHRVKQLQHADELITNQQLPLLVQLSDGMDSWLVKTTQLFSTALCGGCSNFTNQVATLSWYRNNNIIIQIAEQKQN